VKGSDRAIARRLSSRHNACDTRASWRCAIDRRAG
jgi:hypothetical protein